MFAIGVRRAVSTRGLDVAGRRFAYLLGAVPYVIPAVLVALIVLLALAQ
jgi:hypothetical protein